MVPFKTQAYINSLNGGMAEVTILNKPDPNQNYYVAEYRGIKCSAIYNPFVCAYYVDDKYGIIGE